MTKLGYIKRMSVDNFKSQNRGGKGIKGMQTIDEDYIEDLLLTKTHNYIMFFTNTGRVYRLKAMRSRRAAVQPRNRHREPPAAAAGGEDHGDHSSEGIP